MKIWSHLLLEKTETESLWGKFGEGEVGNQSQLHILVRTGSGNWVWWNDRSSFDSVITSGVASTFLTDLFKKKFLSIIMEF